MKARLFILAALLFCMAGCSSITIQNIKSKGMGEAGPPRSEWHNDGLLRFVEFSDSVDLSNRCPRGWRELTVRKSVIQAVMTGMTIGMYDPWEVIYSCNR